VRGGTSIRGARWEAVRTPRGEAASRIHTAVDALGLPVRFEITPRHWGDCPQAQRLIDRLEGVGHVIADAG
jgi:hypothetical protein